MSATAAILVILSAFLHASWNILGKKHRGSGLSFILSSSLSVALLLAPYLIWFYIHSQTPKLPWEFFLVMGLSGLLQIIYLASLLLAYQYADVGAIYPLVRTLPVLLVGFGTSLIGYELNWHQWLGFCLITLGCLIIPITNTDKKSQLFSLGRGFLWIFIAALGTTGYSILDNEALSLLMQSFGSKSNHLAISVFYLGGQFWVVSLFILLWCQLSKVHQPLLAEAWNYKRSGALAGIIMGLTYSLVLTAMAQTDNVSFIVALRQISIVFGLILGIWLLKEPWYHVRGVGITLILTGIVLSFL